MAKVGNLPRLSSPPPFPCSCRSIFRTWQRRWHRLTLRSTLHPSHTPPPSHAPDHPTPAPPFVRLTGPGSVNGKVSTLPSPSFLSPSPAPPSACVPRIWRCRWQRWARRCSPVAPAGPSPRLPPQLATPQQVGMGGRVLVEADRALAPSAVACCLRLLTDRAGRVPAAAAGYPAAGREERVRAERVHAGANG